MLKNEKKQWISDDAYNFNRTNYRLPRSWMSKTILSTNDGKVILENFYDDEVERLISAISSLLKDEYLSTTKKPASAWSRIKNLPK